MEELLNNLISNSSLPILTAFVLGLMTAISPCPLATNITAIGFISKDVEHQKKVFLNGLVYTLGRAISYTLIAVIIFIGADQFKISGWFQQYGEKIIGPLDKTAKPKMKNEKWRKKANGGIGMPYC
jgi:cytochrome c-type biogenesis protein